MKIAFITELFYPSIGGQEVRFEELGRELVKKGHEVTIYAIRHDLESPHEEIMHGIRVMRIFDCASYKNSLLRRNPVGIFGFTWALLRRYNELKSFDHVVFNIWPVLPALVLGHRLGRKSLIDVCETRSGRFWTYVYRQLALITEARILGVSPEIVRHMHKTFGVGTNRSHVLVSGVDIPAIPKPPFEKDAKLILFFGRLSDHKNPEMLAQAFLQSCLPAKGYRLIIAGGGPLLTKLNETYKYPSISFLGRVSEEEKWLWLARASLLVLPSRREGFPRVVAEGACVGTPTLTLDYPDNGTRFVVRDYNLGFSFEATTDSLRCALNEYALNPERYSALVRDLAVRATNEFSWDCVSARFTAFLAEVS